VIIMYISKCRKLKLDKNVEIFIDQFLGNSCKARPCRSESSY